MSRGGWGSGRNLPGRQASEHRHGIGRQDDRCALWVVGQELGPVLSYLLLQGRCRRCKVWISPRYPLVELLTGLLFVGVLWRFDPSWEALLLMVFVAGLVVAAAVDIDHQLIPDEISLGGLALGLVLAAMTGRVLESLLYGVQPGDPIVLGLSATLLAGIAALASWIPAMRASRIDPVEALRTD